MPVVKVGENFETVIPQHLRDELGVKPGDMVQVKWEPVVDVPYTDEVLSAEDQAGLREAQEDVTAGRVSGPFKSAEEVQAHLDFLNQPS